MIRLHLLGALDLTASDGRDLRPLLAQPKRLAVLAYVAARPAGEFVQRDTLLGLFWPDLEQGAARRSLRQTLHVLRQHVGSDALATRGDDAVAVDPDHFSSDVAAFLAATAEGRFAEALDLYRGPLLAGFFLSGASHAFEQWLETERARLAGAARQAAAVLAREAEGAGDLGAAAGWARRALALAPEDEEALRRLLEILARSGDAAGALRAYDAFARQLARDLEAAPARETVELVTRIRIAAGLVEPPATRSSPPPPHTRMPAPGITPATPSSRGRRIWPLAATALVALVLVAVEAVQVLGRHPNRLVLAIGDVTPGDARVSDAVTRVIPDLLAGALAEAGDVAVISHARYEETLDRLADRGTAPSSTEAAQAMGATDLVEGIAYPLGHDSLRLDLQRIDARRGVVQDVIRLRGRDVFTLVDSGAQRLADRLGLRRPPAGNVIGGVSLAARSIYEEGLRAFYRDGDNVTARRLFQDALAADTTFAMAAYYLSQTVEDDPAASREAMRLATRLERYASPREALFIRTRWGQIGNDPAWLALAESLVVRWPKDPEAQLLAANARDVTGNFDGAVAAARAVIRLDSLSLRGSGRCLACDAYVGLIVTDQARDSLPAALRDAEEWVRAQPHSPRAWGAYSWPLDRAGRVQEAINAAATAARLAGRSDVGFQITRAYFAVRAGDLALAESLLRGPAADSTDPQHDDALWWFIVTLRYTGRPVAAIPWAERYQREHAVGQFDDVSQNTLPLGQVLFEAGRLSDAATVFDRTGGSTPEFSHEFPGMAARHRAWALAQRAGVAAAARDTVTLARVADSLAVYGRASAFGRDRRLATYARGLLLRLRGNPRAAADSFRAAIYSPSEGYTRVNLELARTLLSLGQPAEALRWVQSALRGGLEASNYYASQTELHELAGQAFAALGQVDSARVQYAWVVRAWKNAEPVYRTRLLAAQDYLGARTALR